MNTAVLSLEPGSRTSDSAFCSVHSAAVCATALLSVDGDLLDMAMPSQIVVESVMLVSRGQHYCGATFEPTWQPRPSKPPDISSRFEPTWRAGISPHTTWVSALKGGEPRRGRS